MAYNKDYNEELSDDKVSKINSAGLTNITLENLWRECYSALAKGDLTLWNRKLDAIWLVLGGDCKENDGDDKKIRTLNLEIYNLGSLNLKKVGFSKVPVNNQVNTAKQYLLLMEKSLLLRRIQNKQGKGTAYVRDDEYDFD